MEKIDQHVSQGGVPHRKQFEVDFVPTLGDAYEFEGEGRALVLSIGRIGRSSRPAPAGVQNHMSATLESARVSSDWWAHMTTSAHGYARYVWSASLVLREGRCTMLHLFVDFTVRW